MSQPALPTTTPITQDDFQLLEYAAMHPCRSCRMPRDFVPMLFDQAIANGWLSMEPRRGGDVVYALTPFGEQVWTLCEQAWAPYYGREPRALGWSEALPLETAAVALLCGDDAVEDGLLDERDERIGKRVGDLAWALLGDARLADLLGDLKLDKKAGQQPVLGPTDGLDVIAAHVVAWRHGDLSLRLKDDPVTLGLRARFRDAVMALPDADDRIAAWRETVGLGATGPGFKAF